MRFWRRSTSRIEQCGSERRQHQTRQPTAAADVDQPCAVGELAERGRERGRVLGRLLDRVVTPRKPRRCDSRSTSIVSAPHRHAGVITTRRRGSSPSEWLATPSISWIESCTTLRSADAIGSSALVWPVSRTSWATADRELLERRPATLAIAGDVDPEPGLVVAESALRGHAGEILDRHQCPAAGPDQQAEIVTVDTDVELAAVDVEAWPSPGEPNAVGEPGHELYRRLTHGRRIDGLRRLLDGTVAPLPHHRSPWRSAPSAAWIDCASP